MSQPKNHELIYAALKNQQITLAQADSFNRLIEIRTPSFLGTAIFLKYNGSHYLLTARHVLATNSSVDSNEIYKKIILVENDTALNNKAKVNIDKDENIQFNENSGVFFLGWWDLETKNYIFSSKNDDIAILKLGKSDNEFVRTLYSRKYVPIESKDIDSICRLRKGKKIFTIGFPVESTVLQKRFIPAKFPYESLNISNPFVSHGRISDSGKGKNKFEAEIFVYHGNSGGAIISNEKLIGIVSGADFELKKMVSLQNSKNYIVNHSLFVKSSLILPLLKELEKKSK